MAARDGSPPSTDEWWVTVWGTRWTMMVIGLMMVVLGLAVSAPVVWGFGAAILVAGVALWCLGALGHPVASRKHYW